MGWQAPLESKQPAQQPPSWQTPGVPPASVQELVLLVCVQPVAVQASLTHWLFDGWQSSQAKLPLTHWCRSVPA